MTRRIVVIGLGTLGNEVATFLAKSGAEVLAIDKDEHLVDRIKSDVTLAVRADGTELEELRRHQVGEYDGAVIAIGDDIQSSIMCTLMVKKHLEIDEVFARAVNEDHGQILDVVGADTVFHVERQTGRRVAMSIMRPKFRDYFGVSGDLAIVEMNAEESMVGHTLAELDFKNHHRAYCLAIRRGRAGEKAELGGEKTLATHDVVNMPDASARVKADDVLVLIGFKKDLDRF